MTKSPNVWRPSLRQLGLRANIKGSQRSTSVRCGLTPRPRRGSERTRGAGATKAEEQCNMKVKRKKKKKKTRHTFGFKAPISNPTALRMGLDYCRLDLLPRLFTTTSSQGPLPLDQWGYLLRLFQGDFHSGQGIKQTADSPRPNDGLSVHTALCPNVTHVHLEQVANTNKCSWKKKRLRDMLCEELTRKLTLSFFVFFYL